MELELINHWDKAIIDEDDYERASRYNWRYEWSTGYISGRINNRYVLLHRFILNLTDPKIYTDHINRNKLDNRKCNLRKCTPAENSRNRKPTAGHIYKGVKVSKKTGTITAGIVYERKYIYLGRFKTLKEAALAYDLAAIKYHKEFARLNFSGTNN